MAEKSHAVGPECEKSRTVGPEGPAPRIVDGVHRKLHAVKAEEAKSLAVWRQLDSINLADSRFNVLRKTL